MFENVTAGWKLASAIRKIALHDRKLLIYPIVSGLVMLLETVAILLPLFLFNAFNSVLFIVVLFAYYIVIYFTSVYVVMAMLLAFRGYESGKRISVVGALSLTAQYSVVILEWAIFEAIVTMVIRDIEQRLGGLGGMLFGIAASMAVGTASMFAIPVIIDKKYGPIKTLRTSAGFILQNFGKTFGGIMFVDLYSLLFVLAGVVLIASAVLGTSLSLILAAGLGIAGVLFLAYGAMLGYMLGNVYKFVLYGVANGAKPPAGVSREMLYKAIKQKHGFTGGGGIMPGGFGGHT